MLHETQEKQQKAENKECRSATIPPKKRFRSNRVSGRGSSSKQLGLMLIPRKPLRRRATMISIPIGCDRKSIERTGRRPIPAIPEQADARLSDTTRIERRCQAVWMSDTGRRRSGFRERRSSQPARQEGDGSADAQARIIGDNLRIGFDRNKGRKPGRQEPTSRSEHTDHLSEERQCSFEPMIGNVRQEA